MLNFDQKVPLYTVHEFFRLNIVYYMKVLLGRRGLECTVSSEEKCPGYDIAFDGEAPVLMVSVGLWRTHHFHYSQVHFNPE